MAKQRNDKFGSVLEAWLRLNGYRDDQKKFDQFLDEITLPEEKEVKKLLSRSTVLGYINGTMRPTFDRLVRIAEVTGYSLDYLVYGKQAAPSLQLPDLGPVMRGMYVALAAERARNEEHARLYSRIAQALSGQVRDAARIILGQETDKPLLLGIQVLDVDDSIALEENSSECLLALMDFHEVGRDQEDQPTQGRYFYTVVRNLKRDDFKGYQILLPHHTHTGNRWGETNVEAKAAWQTVVNSYGKQLKKAEVDEYVQSKKCQFKVTKAPCFLITGCTFLKVDPKKLAASARPTLLERIRDFMDPQGWIGLIVPPGHEPPVEWLMDGYHRDPAKEIIEGYWKAGDEILVNLEDAVGPP